VRRGDLELDAVLDLHGHTQDRAQRALARFLIQAQADGARVVLVITGKGRGGAEGVLKARLLDWLGAPGIRPLIAGFAEAHARHGGAGAAYVFLKRSA
jgi:DNA-nicking Smr family endonuclease